MAGRNFEWPAFSSLKPRPAPPEQNAGFDIPAAGLACGIQLISVGRCVVFREAAVAPHRSYDSIFTHPSET